MNKIKNIISGFISSFKLSPNLTEIFTDITLAILLLATVILGYFVIRTIYVLTLKKFGLKSNKKWVVAVLESPIIPHFIKLIPSIFLLVWIREIGTFESFFKFILIFNIAYLVIKISYSALDLVNTIYKEYNEQARLKPIKGILTFIKIGIFLLVAIIITSYLLGESPTSILTALGAMSAVIMLIFKDSILGLVAGFQMSANDLIRIGDWIEVPGQGVDGDVVDVTLTFVQVQNWDKTTVTIPANKLISSSFVNWRSVFDTGGRRIKRSINLDNKSVKILDDELFDKLMKVDYLKDYLTSKKEEIDKYNNENNFDTSVELNGRRLTNLGVYRIYLTEYLKRNPSIKQGLTLLVRQLQTTNQGIPLEVYAFSAKTSLSDYEGLMSDIFDHIYATTSYFELKLFQEPSGNDITNLIK